MVERLEWFQQGFGGLARRICRRRSCKRMSGSRRLEQIYTTWYRKAWEPFPPAWRLLRTANLLWKLQLSWALNLVNTSPTGQNSNTFLWWFQWISNQSYRKWQFYCLSQICTSCASGDLKYPTVCCESLEMQCFCYLTWTTRDWFYWKNIDDPWSPTFRGDERFLQKLNLPQW